MATRVVSVKSIGFPSLIVTIFFFSSFSSYALFDKHGQQVPQEIVSKVGETFERILKEVLQSLTLNIIYSMLLWTFVISLLLVNISDCHSKR
jgi:hypothetical protein